MLPRLIESAGGAQHKAVYLGLVTGLGAIAALIFNPLAGYFSDRWVTSDNRSTVVSIGLVGRGAVAWPARRCSGRWSASRSAGRSARPRSTSPTRRWRPRSSTTCRRRDWGFAWGLIAVSQALGIILGFGAIVLVFPSVTGGMTAITVMYAVGLVPLVVLLRPAAEGAAQRAPAGPSARASRRC